MKGDRRLLQRGPRPEGGPEKGTFIEKWVFDRKSPLFPAVARAGGVWLWSTDVKEAQPLLFEALSFFHTDDRVCRHLEGGRLHNMREEVFLRSAVMSKIALEGNSLSTSVIAKPLFLSETPRGEVD